MSRKSLLVLMLQGRVQLTRSIRWLSSATGSSTTGSSSDSKSTQSSGNTYQVPEYYRYNTHSYYDIDMAMLKYRLEQPKPGGKY